MKMSANKISKNGFSSFSGLSAITCFINAVSRKEDSVVTEGILAHLLKEHGADIAPSAGHSTQAEQELNLSSVDTLEQAVKVLRSIWDEELFDFQESLYALYLDSRNKLLGFSLISTGMTNAENADPELILNKASQYVASRVIIAHNHPSGVNKPSESDLEYTRLVEKACEDEGVEFRDHLILTAQACYSIGLNRKL